MQVNLTNNFGLVKTEKVGFSIPAFLLGFFYMLYKGDYILALITFGCALVASYLLEILGSAIVWIAAGLLFNQLHIKELLKKALDQ